MSRKNGNKRPKVKNRLKNLTHDEYGIIVNSYLKRVHSMNFFKRLRFAFNVLIKGERKK